MEIPLGTTENQDVYTYGFDKNLNRGLEDRSTGTVYDTIENAINAGSVLSGGNLSLKTLQIGGFTRMVAPGDDLQAALDAVNREGGGTVQLLAAQYLLRSNITIPSNVALIGSGRDLTIIDFGEAAYSLRCRGTSTDLTKNFALAHLTIQNSSDEAGLDIQYTEFWRIENIRITSCTQKGMRVIAGSNYLVNNCRFDNNGSHGIFLYNDGTTEAQALNFTYNVVTCDSNGANGMLVDRNSNNSNEQLQEFSITNCNFSENTINGLFLDSSASNTPFYANVVGCSADDNTEDGIKINTSGVQVLGCRTENNLADNYDVSATGTGVSLLVGCISNGSLSAQEYNIGNNVVVIACNYTDFAPDEEPSQGINYTGINDFRTVFLNTRDTPITERRIHLFRNDSGSTINAGDVVTYATNATGDRITRTTTVGDRKVWGVAPSQIASGSNGSVIISGFYTQVNVNGTTDIAVGDYLCTYSEAGIAQKATTTGQVVFAIALEAYTTNDSNGFIDAYIIPWRFPLP